MSGDWRPATQVPGERSAFDNPCEYCGDRIVNHSPNELKSCFDDLSARADYLYRDLTYCGQPECDIYYCHDCGDEFSEPCPRHEGVNTP